MVKARQSPRRLRKGLALALGGGGGGGCGGFGRWAALSTLLLTGLFVLTSRGGVSGPSGALLGSDPAKEGAGALLRASAAAAAASAPLLSSTSNSSPRAVRASSGSAATAAGAGVANSQPVEATSTTRPRKGPPASSSAVTSPKVSDPRSPASSFRMGDYVKKRSGGAGAGGGGAPWKVWDGTAVLHPDAQVPCRWADYRAVASASSSSAADAHADADASSPPAARQGRMCLYPDGQDQFVSKTIAEKGHWEDCDDLTESLQGKARPVYVDVGTNIGACVMQVLLTTNASIVAFEPSPPNLFRLTSTLLDLPPPMRSRVTLFPVALGEATGKVAIMANPSNSGNTQVRRSEGENGVDGASRETRDIPVERIDDLISPELPIDLLKMDAQGYECFVVGGMKETLQNVQRIKFEIDDAIGKRFGDADACVGARLVKALQLSHFVVKTATGSLIDDMTGLSHHDLLAVDLPNPQDLVAERKSAAQVAPA